MTEGITDPATKTAEPGPGTVIAGDSKAPVTSAGPGPGSVMYDDPAKAPPRPGSEDVAASKVISDDPKPFHKDPDGMPVERAMKSAWNTGTRVELKILLAAKVDRVFRAVTEPGELTKWFCRTAKTELKTGGRFSVGWIAGKTADWQVSEFTPGKKLTLKRPETVSFAFSTEGDRTLLQLSAELPEDLQQFAAEQSLWGSHLLYLKAWVEHGIDLRESDAARTWKDGFVNGTEPA